MLYLHYFLVLVNYFFLIIGTATNSSRYLKYNPVPALERHFSRSLYQRLALESGGGNLLVSPLGVDVLLATILEGAHGDDRVHLISLLNLNQVDGFPYRDVKLGYLQMLQHITSSLQILTRFYIHNDFVVNKDFLSIANTYYQTGAELLNLTNKQEAVKAINGYVKKNTNHAIREVVTEGDLSDDPTMVCISTTHFQAQWALLFPKQVTSKQQFRPSSKTHSSVHMMRVRNQFHFEWNATLRAKILALELITENFSMIFILPDKEDELLDLEARLAHVDYLPLLSLVRSTPPVNVDLWLPRFTLREDLDLAKTLEQMGLGSLFTPNADLSGISSEIGLHVSKMKLKSHLVVGENGVEASSTEGWPNAAHPNTRSTYQPNPCNPTPAAQPTPSLFSCPIMVEAEEGTAKEDWQEFRADHPFIFFLIMDELVVYQGRVVEP